MRAPEQTERVSVSHTAPDRVVQRVLDQIDHERLVSSALGNDGVEGVIDQLAHRGRSAAGFTLDLIGHARRGILHLGDWSIDGNGVSAALQRACAHALSGLELTGIRLLGCNTAITRDGQAAMRRLHDVFKVPVIGTKMPISARDFVGTGFRSEAILTDHAHLPPPAGPTMTLAAQWFVQCKRVEGEKPATVIRRLRRESFADAILDWTRTRPQLRWPVRQISHAQLDDILEGAQADVGEAPGLLALPDLELVVPISDGFGAPRYHRITALLDGYWLRVYPRDRPDGVVLRPGSDDVVATALRLGTEILRA